jgi:hypothetical protein
MTWARSLSQSWSSRRRRSNDDAAEGSAKMPRGRKMMAARRHSLIGSPSLRAAKQPTVDVGDAWTASERLSKGRARSDGAEKKSSTSKRRPSPEPASAAEPAPQCPRHDRPAWERRLCDAAHRGADVADAKRRRRHAIAPAQGVGGFTLSEGGTGSGGGARIGAGADSEHAGSYMLLYPVCQAKNNDPDIFSPPRRRRIGRIPAAARHRAGGAGSGWRPSSGSRRRLAGCRRG